MRASGDRRALFWAVLALALLLAATVLTNTVLRDFIRKERERISELEGYIEARRRADRETRLLEPPVAQYTISSGVGYRVNPMGGGEENLHRGVDVPGEVGVPVRAAGTGRVLVTWPAPGQRRADGVIYRGHPELGGLVEIDHGGGLITRYGHLSLVRVKRGDLVKAGDLIGSLGATGKATGPHLHFELVADPCILFSPWVGETQ